MINDYLDALNYVWYNYYTEELSQDEVEQIEKHLNIVQDSLKRLESIDNSKPSEALECLERFFNSRKIYEPNNTVIFDCITCLNTIKQALIKSQEQEKVLKILKERQVNIALL